jgi:RND family efflux transporter MFP subunit
MIAAVLLLGCGDERRGAEIRPAAALDGGPARPVATAPDAGARGFVGVLVAAESVDVAPRFEGVIAEVRVRAGDRVAAGQIVAEMDAAPLREELRAAEAALRATVAAQRQADVDLRDAERTLETETAAVAAGTSARQARDDAEVAVQRARAARERARSLVAEERSRVETARARLDDTGLRAPFAGVIGMRYKDAGSTIGAGTAIVRVVGEGGLRLRFAVPPGELRDLAPDQEVDAAIETVDAPVPAVIRQVSPALDPASGMILVEAELRPPAEVASRLRPGMPAEVRRR